MDLPAIREGHHVQREASRLSMMQGELQAAREAAEKLVPQTRPDPEPWPPNARYTNSVQPKGPREIQVGPAMATLS